LPLRPAGSYTVRIADNTIGFERGPSGDNVVAPAEVGVASLHGQEHVVARNGEANVLYPSFDYDGHRLAWWSYGCRRPQVEYLEASSRSGPGLNRTGCRLLFKRAPQLDGRFKLRFAVDCYGFFGCSVPKLVMAESHDRKAVIARGRGRHARLTKLGRRALDRAGRVRVRVQAIITDGAGRRERRSTSVVLQSARRG
jgi:hypothetical protein